MTIKEQVLKWRKSFKEFVCPYCKEPIRIKCKPSCRFIVQSPIGLSMKERNKDAKAKKKPTRTGKFITA